MSDQEHIPYSVNCRLENEKRDLCYCTCPHRSGGTAFWYAPRHQCQLRGYQTIEGHRLPIYYDTWELITRSEMPSGMQPGRRVGKIMSARTPSEFY